MIDFMNLTGCVHLPTAGTRWSAYRRHHKFQLYSDSNWSYWTNPIWHFYIDPT